MGERNLGKLDLVRLVLRSFYLQAAWNYEGLQTLGFAYVMFPVARKLGCGTTATREFAVRHLRLFNTNPVLASYIIGATAKLEEERERGKVSAADVEALKSSLAVPLAAVGDRFFWASMRPLSGMLGVLIAGGFGVLGAVALLVLYNVFHIYYRVKGVLRGYTLGAGVVGEIPKLRLMTLSRTVGWVGAATAGILLVGVVHAWSGGWKREALLLLPVVAIASGLLRESFQKRITEVAIAVGAAGLVLTASGIFG
ncbi:MAG: PTS system mannose/fructose/sorbose family transporter subunit IID [Candidatus Eisenbacteria bacterium]|nr:PTS system mannose/fructose/sorbose family transporter subunit IID [Candidatus Eisenbacteria bacterium]